MKEWIREKIWVWGYTMDKVPGHVPFVPGTVHCSLETAVEFMGARNAVMLNPIDFTLEINESAVNCNGLKLLSNCNEVVCSLGQDIAAMPKIAEYISETSLKYSNISGVVIDDFLLTGGETENMTPGQLKSVYEALKSRNPELKLYVVRYTNEDLKVIEPFLEYFDVINLWVWVSTEHFWRAEYEPYLRDLRKIYGKEVLQGIFLHNYGETWDKSEEAVSPEMLELICSKVFPKIRSNELAGVVFLQNGWFAYPNHRRSVLKVKEYLNWFAGISTFPR